MLQCCEAAGCRIAGAQQVTTRVPAVTGSAPGEAVARRGADGAGMERPLAGAAVRTARAACLQPALRRRMHTPRGVLHVACTGHATERRAADAPGSSSVADVPVWHRRLVDDWHGEAPRIAFLVLMPANVAPVSRQSGLRCRMPGIGKLRARPGQTVVPQGFAGSDARSLQARCACRWCPGRASLLGGNAGRARHSGARDGWTRSRGVVTCTSLGRTGRNFIQKHEAVPVWMSGIQRSR